MNRKSFARKNLFTAGFFLTTPASGEIVLARNHELRDDNIQEFNLIQ